MSILDKAKEIVQGSRQADYGKPADNHARTAILWNAYLDAKRLGRSPSKVVFGPEDVCFLAILQKIGRELNAPKDDNLVDIAGYAYNVELIRRSLDPGVPSTGQELRDDFSIRVVGRNPTLVEIRDDALEGLRAWVEIVREDWDEYWKGRENHPYGRFSCFLGERLMSDFDLPRR